MGSQSLSPAAEKRIEYFARFGIVAKGIVYCLIGILTSMAALGLKGGKADKTETFQFVYDQPLGSVLVFIIAIGLAGYATWRFFQAFRDIEHKGNDTRGRLVRVGYAISGFIYITLSVYALRLVFNGNSDGGENSQRFIVSKILDYPFGKWLVFLVALIILINGIRQIYKGISAKFLKHVSITGKHAEIFRKAGIAGYVARGLVLSILAYFFFRAAASVNANEVTDTKGAFSFIENNFGAILLAIVATGLICYGVFMFVKARYQKIDLNF